MNLSDCTSINCNGRAVLQIKSRADGKVVWRRTYSVRYNPGSKGIGNRFEQRGKYGMPYSVSSEVFSRGGYKQTGWSLFDGGALKYNFGDLCELNRDLDLYPVWAPYN